MLCGKKLHHACMNAVSFREASGGRMPASEMERSGIERPCEAGRNGRLDKAGECPRARWSGAESSGPAGAGERLRSGIERPCEAGRNACLAAAGERLQTRQKKEGGQII